MIPPAVKNELTTSKSARLVTTLAVTHQTYNDQPDGLQIISSVPLFLEETPYSLRIKVGRERKPLPVGHLSDGNSSIILIENYVGKFPQTNPTDAEKEEMARQVIEIYLQDSTTPILVRPGLFTIFETYNPSCATLRCAVDNTPCKVHVYPR